MAVFKNCPVTKRDASIRKAFNIFEAKDYCEGYEIYAEKVYSLFRGVVLDIFNLDDHKAVIFQYSENIAFLYGHLKEVSVNEGQIINNYTVLGIADEYVYVEYLTSTITDVGLQVSIPPNICLYKHNPLPILSGNVAFKSGVNRKDTDIRMYQALYEDGRSISEIMKKL